MTTATSHKNAQAESSGPSQKTDAGKDITRDIIDHLSEYAKENPGHAALACLAVGFILGWKLKPW